MRLVVARCEVVYTGRLNAVLPEATRLLMPQSIRPPTNLGGVYPRALEVGGPRLGYRATGTTSLAV